MACLENCPEGFEAHCRRCQQLNDGPIAAAHRILAADARTLNLFEAHKVARAFLEMKRTRKRKRVRQRTIHL